MSPTPVRRRGRAATLAVVAAVSVLALAGCTTTQKDKSNYADTEEDFLAGCVRQAEADNEVEGATRISDPEAFCECAFAAIEDTIPFEEFNDINADLRDNGGALPEEFVAAYEGCDPGEGA